MKRKKKTTASTPANLPSDYGKFLHSLKQRVRQAQTKAALSVNRELIQLYWDIGRLFVEHQEREGWGTKVLERLATDLQNSFPGIQGFSRSNLFRMRAFFNAYSGSGIVAQPVRQLEKHPRVAQPVRLAASEEQASPPARGTSSEDLSQAATVFEGTKPPQAVAGIPWGHNIVILQKLKDDEQRLWYAAKTVEHGWSRAILTAQIESGLYGRRGKAISNFADTLPPSQSELAQQSLKDPYLFDFLTLHDDAVERDLEQALVDHIQRFLLELGAGFAFVGRQFHFTVDEDDFYIDLLFYHLQLRCFVVVDLKMRKFTPEHAGKMNFYLSAIDSQLRHPDDGPSIGLILCKDRNQITAEYALRDIAKPIGIAEWQTKIVDSLPESLKGRLPTIVEIERELTSNEDTPTKPQTRKREAIE